MERKTDFIIYGLAELNSTEIRYIGKSTSGLKRPKQHHCPSTFLNPYRGNKNLTKRQAWLKSLYLKQEKCRIIKLCTVLDPKDLSQVEIDYIKYYRERGSRLINGTDGGEGYRGGIPWNKGKTGVSKETREKMSKAKRGKLPPNAKKVMCLKTGEIYESTVAAGKVLGISPAFVQEICKGLKKSSKGHDLGYQEDHVLTVEKLREVKKLLDQNNVPTTYRIFDYYEELIKDDDN